VSIEIKETEIYYNNRSRSIHVEPNSPYRSVWTTSTDQQHVDRGIVIYQVCRVFVVFFLKAIFLSTGALVSSEVILNEELILKSRKIIVHV
jgi:hypothetical protein